MINILAWIVLGGLAGWLASHIGRSGEGIVGALLVGILGALIGGIIFAIMLPGAFGMAHSNPATWGVAAISAAILLFLVRAMSKTLRNPMRFEGGR